MFRRTLLSFGIALMYTSLAHANLDVLFANGDDLDDSVVGGSASFTDAMTGVTGTLTTRTLLDAAGSAIGVNGPTKVNTTTGSSSGTLGVRSDPSDGVASLFDGSEAWGFDWDINTSLIEVGFKSFIDDEGFVIQSDDWKNLVGVTPETVFGIENIVYDPTAGSFTIEDLGSNTYSLMRLTGGVPLDVTAGTEVLFSYVEGVNTPGNSAGINSLQFSTTPPDPDFNGDGDVDDDDLALWSSGFGKTDAIPTDGDADGNAVVDGRDFLSWQRGYSLGAGSPSTAVVPEPTTCSLAILSLLGCMSIACRSRNRTASAY